MRSHRYPGAFLLLSLCILHPALAVTHIHIVTPDTKWPAVRLWKMAGKAHGAEVTASAERNFKPGVIEILMGDDRELPKLPRSMLEPLRSEEAYCVYTIVDSVSPPTMAVWGHSERGVTAGAAWLLTQVTWTAQGVEVPKLMVAREPFFRGREATLCPTGRILKDRPQLARHVNYELWDEAQLRRYPPFLLACGFNSVQIMELIGNDRSPGYRDGGDRAKIAPVLQTLADEAHRQGMRVSQYVWGSADGLHWDQPTERPARERRYEELAATYGKYVDHVVTHWIDEGYEGGYVVPQEATAFIQTAYRKHNPKVQVSFDAWGNAAFWQGDARARQFLDATFCPTDIGVALERWYDADRVQKIRATGRRVGIWGWYLGDYEMEYASHLETRILDKYFSALPEAAGRDVDWQCIELCFHALPSEINLFVAGQKMWTPKRPLREILRDYCRAVYGEKNADAMVLAYETVEEGQKDVKTYGMFIPESDRFPNVRNTTAYHERARRALDALNQLVLPAGWVAAIPVVGSPAQDIKDLGEELRVVLSEKTQ